MTDEQRKQFIEEQIEIFPADCEMGEFLRDIAKLQLCDGVISKQAVLDVLDKIRKRIELEKLGYPPSAGYYKAIVKCLQIIDKYKAESEGKLSWLGKNCKDCGNEKCKKLGTLPKGYDCALWQSESEDKG